MRIKDYVEDYVNSISYHLKAIPEKTWKDALALMGYTRSKNRVFVAGNGGSAAIANHLTCDFSKGCEVMGHEALKTFSLSCNVPLITAIANDYNYDEVFSRQLGYAGLVQEDIVILISSSGNSKNIVSAAQFAQIKGAKIIGLTGFDGGILKEVSDISFHIPIKNYGIVEDSHQAIMHCLAQMHKKEMEKWF